MLLFVNGSKPSLSALKALMVSYEAASSQMVNVTKTGFLVSIKVRPSRIHDIVECTRFSH